MLYTIWYMNTQHISYIRVHYILVNLVSKIHITKIGIAKINGWGCIIWMMIMLFVNFKYAKNANKLLK